MCPSCSASLIGEDVEAWNCPIHQWALMAKRPVEAMMVAHTSNFDAAHAMNIPNKWWWMFDNHRSTIEQYSHDFRTIGATASSL